MTHYGKKKEEDRVIVGVKPVVPRPATSLVSTSTLCLISSHHIHKQLQ